jgi:predicted short-subunit dehydrogenase-like oxidoreductase (DUF2520 family)
MASSEQIILIGAGNVGFHMGQALTKAGLKIHQVFSRSETKALRLASTINCSYSTSFEQISDEASVYILAVTDQAIPKVAKALASRLKGKKPLVVHTSGATPATVLEPCFERYGVFYPLQTFSVEQPVDFQKIPLLVFANRSADLEWLQQAGALITPLIYHIDDQQRKVLHIAAVMVNNFTNLLYSQAERLSKQHDFPFELLQPLIRETVQKIERHSPADMQTGPAIRGDEATINSHLDFLEKNYPDLKELYQLMTQLIRDTKN